MSAKCNAATIMTVASILVGCGQEDYDDQERKIVNFIESNPAGATDYWIVAKGPLGYSKIGLIFGFPDDGAACEDAVRLMNIEYPNRFLCEPAN